MPFDEAKPNPELAVIGAGNMGSGIAQKMATRSDAYEGLTSLGRKRPEFHGR